ncbi:hypothetical protein ACQP25_44635 (plasmid) [Microtetraspora malaysiensis]|uniref:hypothetical protein n=1 Tax=Microtetraspora malaysiensis TaxID=161358 RepID=UPI003D9222F7
MVNPDDPDAAADLFLDLYLAAGAGAGDRPDPCAFLNAVNRRIDADERELAILREIRDWEIARLYDDGRGVPAKVLANRTGHSPTWVSRHAKDGEEVKLGDVLARREQRLTVIASDETLPAPIRERAAQRVSVLSTVVSRLSARLTGAAAILGPAWAIVTGNHGVPGYNPAPVAGAGGGLAIGSWTLTTQTSSVAAAAGGSTAGPVAAAAGKFAVGLVTGIQAVTGVSAPVAAGLAAAPVALAAAPIVQKVEQQLVPVAPEAEGDRDENGDEFDGFALAPSDSPSPSASASSSPSLSPSDEVATPSPTETTTEDAPTETPTPTVTVTPAVILPPSPTPTRRRPRTPTPTPIVTTTPTHSSSPTPTPTATTPTATPTPTLTVTPSPVPIITPSTDQPTPEPTPQPTEHPTTPTDMCTVLPSLTSREECAPTTPEPTPTLTAAPPTSDPTPSEPTPTLDPAPTTAPEPGFAFGFLAVVIPSALS